MLKKICKFISQYMGILVLLVAITSLLLPQVFSVVKTSYINPLLGMVMFGMGLTLNPTDFKIVFSKPHNVIVGCLAQFTIMPLLALGLTKVFALPPELAIGVILVGCCPGGTSSNVITYLSEGDLALSVGMTGVSTLLAPFLTPLLTWLLAGAQVNVDMLSMCISIMQVVILPIIGGFLIQHYFPKFTRSVTDFLPAFSALSICLIVAAVVSANATKLLTGGALIILVVMLHNIFGYILGYVLGLLMRMKRKERIAISVEVGMQNSGLASSLATLHFATYPLATVPGAVFSVWHNISGALIARLFTWKRVKKEKA